MLLKRILLTPPLMLELTLCHLLGVTSSVMTKHQGCSSATSRTSIQTTSLCSVSSIATFIRHSQSRSLLPQSKIEMTAIYWSKQSITESSLAPLRLQELLKIKNRDVLFRLNPPVFSALRLICATNHGPCPSRVGPRGEADERKEGRRGIRRFSH